MAELYQFAGRQFDPELVRKFEELFSQDQNLMSEKLSRRWLHRLPQDGAGVPWSVAAEYVRVQAATDPTPSIFEKGCSRSGRSAAGANAAG